MSNLCEGCPLPCCLKFAITDELFDPPRYRQTLAKFPFIHATGSTHVRVEGETYRVKTHSCDRFDPTTGECNNYTTIPRPSFCERTGNIHKPHPNCLL